jgi:hypothetical protein
VKSYYDFLFLVRNIATIDVDGVQIGKFMQVFMYRNDKCCDNDFNMCFGGTLYWERRKVAEKRGHMVWVERKSNRARFK